MSVKLWLIGTCRLTIDDVPVELTGNKLLALLAYMATERGPHTREILMTLFWGENPQERAMNSLRQFLYKLRVLLPEGILETARLTAGIPDDVDLWTDVAVLQAAANAGNPSNDMLIQAAGLINGPFMNGVNLPDAPEFDAWQ